MLRNFLAIICAIFLYGINLLLLCCYFNVFTMFSEKNKLNKLFSRYLGLLLYFGLNYTFFYFITKVLQISFYETDSFISLVLNFCFIPSHNQFFPLTYLLFMNPFIYSCLLTTEVDKFVLVLGFILSFVLAFSF